MKVFFATATAIITAVFGFAFVNAESIIASETETTESIVENAVSDAAPAMEKASEAVKSAVSEAVPATEEAAAAEKLPSVEIPDVAAPAVEQAASEAPKATSGLPAPAVEVPAEPGAPEPAIETVPAPVSSVATEGTPAADSNGRFVIGIETTLIPAPVRAQVQIPENIGLFVYNVVPEGPAGKAGIKQFDILAALNGTPLTSNEQLIESLQKTQANPQTLTILRAGKELHLTIVPEKRAFKRFGGFAPAATIGFPTPGAFAGRPGIPSADPAYAPAVEDDFGFMDENMRRVMNMQRRQMEQMRLRLERMEKFFKQDFRPNPGNVPAPAINADPNVQTNSFSMQYEKQNDQPAVMTIDDNGKQYKVDENSVDQLPENVRSRIRIIRQ